MRVKPKQRRLTEFRKDLRKDRGTVTLVHPNVLRPCEPDPRQARKCWLKLNGVDSIEVPAKSPCSLTHVRACLDQNPEGVLLRRLP